MINGSEAFLNAKNNKNRSMTKWYENHNGIADDLTHTPKFKINEKTKFFTIGSCFARNIEAQLKKRKIDLLSDAPILSSDFYQLEGGKDRSGYQNVYTPGSVLEVLKLSNGRDRYHSIIDNRDNSFDLLTSGLKPLPIDKVKSIRSDLVDLYVNIKNTDVLIITLGYNESWIFNKEKSYLNRTPSHPFLRKKSNDFSFCTLDFFNILDVLEESISIYKSTNPNGKIIFTVSPVPLGATFSDRHIISANQLSKSLLLSVANLLKEKYDFIDYFPSYEIVVNSEKSKVFKPDGIHVQSSIVGKIMDVFFKSYF